MLLLLLLLHNDNGYRLSPSERGRARVERAHTHRAPHVHYNFLSIQFVHSILLHNECIVNAECAIMNIICWNSRSGMDAFVNLSHVFERARLVSTRTTPTSVTSARDIFLVFSVSLSLSLTLFSTPIPSRSSFFCCRHSFLFRPFRYTHALASPPK